MTNVTKINHHSTHYKKIMIRINHCPNGGYLVSPTRICITQLREDKQYHPSSRPFWNLNNICCCRRGIYYILNIILSVISQKPLTSSSQETTFRSHSPFPNFLPFLYPLSCVLIGQNSTTVWKLLIKWLQIGPFHHNSTSIYPVVEDDDGHFSWNRLTRHIHLDHTVDLLIVEMDYILQV